MEQHPRSKPVRMLMHLGTVLFFALLLSACLWAWKQGLFRSLDTLQAFIDSYEVGAPLIFVLLQVLQILVAVSRGDTGKQHIFNNIQPDKTETGVAEFRCSHRRNGQRYIVERMPLRRS